MQIGAQVARDYGSLPSCNMDLVASPGANVEGVEYFRDGCAYHNHPP